MKNILEILNSSLARLRSRNAKLKRERDEATAEIRALVTILRQTKENRDALRVCYDLAKRDGLHHATTCAALKAENDALRGEIVSFRSKVASALYGNSALDAQNDVHSFAKMDSREI